MAGLTRVRVAQGATHAHCPDLYLSERTLGGGANSHDAMQLCLRCPDSMGRTTPTSKAGYNDQKKEKSQHTDIPN